VLVDGVRLPFAQAGTIYKDLMAYDLARMSMKGLIDHTALDPNEIDYVLFGNVVQEGKMMIIFV
jgi:acetyl-CoA acetyltransferase